MCRGRCAGRGRCERGCEWRRDERPVWPPRWAEGQVLQATPSGLLAALGWRPQALRDRGGRGVCHPRAQDTVSWPSALITAHCPVKVSPGRSGRRPRAGLCRVRLWATLQARRTFSNLALQQPPGGSNSGPHESRNVTGWGSQLSACDPRGSTARSWRHLPPQGPGNTAASPGDRHCPARPQPAPPAPPAPPCGHPCSLPPPSLHGCLQFPFSSGRLICWGRQFRRKERRTDAGGDIFLANPREGRNLDSQAKLCAREDSRPEGRSLGLTGARPETVCMPRSRRGGLDRARPCPRPTNRVPVCARGFGFALAVGRDKPKGCCQKQTVADIVCGRGRFQMNPNQLILPQHPLSLNIHITRAWWGVQTVPPTLTCHVPGKRGTRVSPSRPGSCSRGPGHGAEVCLTSASRFAHWVEAQALRLHPTPTHGPRASWPRWPGRCEGWSFPASDGGPWAGPASLPEQRPV